MEDLFQAAIAHSIPTLKGNVGWWMTYRAPGEEGDGLPVIATPTGQNSEVFTEPMPTKQRRLDFLVAKADFAGRALPRHGGALTITRGGVFEKYEVLPPGENLPAVQDWDAAGTMLRLHTIKKIDEAE